MKQTLVILTAAFIMVACANAQTQQTNPYFTGDGGKGIRIAVLEPAGNGLSNDEQWMLSLIQGTIYTVFNNYSAMTLIDKQNIEKIFAEWEQSMSGNYSDADRVKIGNLTNASHILSGTVIKTPNAFMLELSVTDLQSGERKASYSQPVSTSALENHSAIKGASAELLRQLGVNLTSTALGELKQATNIARIQADEALARGIKAQKQGTEVAALSYFFQAAILDPSLAEAVNRSSVMAANVSSGNIGEDARNDIEWRKSWIKRLEETEQYINHLNKTVSMPYTLFYSDEIIRGGINYEKETMSLSIKTNLYGSGSIMVWALSVEQALQAVYDGLEATKRKSTWGLNWPRNNVTNLNSFKTQSRTFTVIIELVNSKNMVIGRQELNAGGGWVYDVNGRPGVSVGYVDYGRGSNYGRTNVVFTNVKAYDITDNLTIQFASVNGEDAETAARKGVLQIKAMPKSEFDDSDRFTFAFGDIHNYKKTIGGDFTIPNTIWDDPVISIRESAFNNKSLTGVTIPNSVTIIGNSAFTRNALTIITIGENVRLDQNSFGNGFEQYYHFDAGRRAGTYARQSTSRPGGWYREFDGQRQRTAAASDNAKTYNLEEAERGFAQPSQPSKVVAARTPDNSVNKSQNHLIIENGVVRGFNKSILKVEIQQSGNREVSGFSPSLSNSQIQQYRDFVLFTESGGKPIVKSIEKGAFRTYGTFAAYYPRYDNLGYFFTRSKQLLTSVTIVGNGVTFIGDNAFDGHDITKITIGANITLGKNAFGRGFEKFYQSNGSNAGTYTYDKGSKKWSYSPQ